MSNDNFILHEWEKEKLDALVESQMKKRLLQEGIEQGLEQGLEQGIEQGSKEKQIEIAKNMLAKGTDIKFISEVTGLEKEEIEAFR